MTTPASRKLMFAEIPSRNAGDFSCYTYDMKCRRSQGFTLIELLVVIAIIGVLSAVVLGSLNSARLKGSDAATKKGLSGARAQAEVFYSVNGYSYANVCLSTAVAGVKTVYSQVLGAASSQGLGSFGRNVAGTASTATCHDTAAGWAAEVPLKAGGMFCVDSTGAGMTTGGSVLTVTSPMDVTCG